MADYISREAILKDYQTICNGVECVRCPIRDKGHCKFEAYIRSIPAADVRPVVRCGECKHWEKYDNTAGCGYCNKVKFEYGQIGYVFKPVREPDFFCADGEKREES